MVQPEHQDQLAVSVQVEPQVCLVLLEALEHLDITDLLEYPVRRVYLEALELLVLQAHQVNLDQMDSQAV